jgi:hypothetical protein
MNHVIINRKLTAVSMSQINRRLYKTTQHYAFIMDMRILSQLIAGLCRGKFLT